MRIEDLLERATAASQGGRKEEARDLLVDVLAVDPGNLDAWLRLADLAASPERSALYYQRAADIDPRSLRAQRGLQQALAILGPSQETPEPGPVSPSQPSRPARSRPVPSAGNPYRGVVAPSTDAPIYVDNDSAPFALRPAPAARPASRRNVPEQTGPPASQDLPPD